MDQILSTEYDFSLKFCSSTQNPYITETKRIKYVFQTFLKIKLLAIAVKEILF